MHLQILTLKIKHPDGTVKAHNFIGPAITSPEGWDELKKNSLGELIQGIQFLDPEPADKLIGKPPELQHLSDIISDS